MHELETVVGALSRIRAPRTTSEYDLHALVAEALAASALPFRHEAPVAPRRRIDFLCGCVGVEVKRGKPGRAPLLRQLLSYAQSPAVAAIVLVSERLPRLPDELLGKPLVSVGLNRLWGIAL